MDPIITLISLSIIVLGLVVFLKPEWVVKLDNIRMGRKTQITETTIIWQKFIGIISIIIGIALYIIGNSVVFK